MALTNAYLITTKNLADFFNAIKTAKAPERFTNRFLQQLDLTSSNDRLFIGVMKGLGFIDESGVPTKRYYEFLDQTQSGRVLAEAIKEAYDDLFSVNIQAHEMEVEEVKNKLRTLTMGQKSDNVLSLMANTFKALCELADWEAPPPESKKDETPIESKEPGPPGTPHPPPLSGRAEAARAAQFHYNIQIHLPESRDPAVFDAIFEALRRHLGS